MMIYWLTSIIVGSLICAGIFSSLASDFSCAFILFVIALIASGLFSFSALFIMLLGNKWMQKQVMYGYWIFGQILIIHIIMIAFDWFIIQLFLPGLVEQDDIMLTIATAYAIPNFLCWVFTAGNRMTD